MWRINLSGRAKYQKKALPLRSGLFLLERPMAAIVGASHARDCFYPGHGPLQQILTKTRGFS